MDQRIAAGAFVVIDVLIYCTLAGLAYVREQAERAARAEALRARAALEAMRSQLNPHFILNTFHALVGLVRRDPAAAEGALERLGDLLRYSLRVNRDGITYDLDRSCLMQWYVYWGLTDITRPKLRRRKLF